MDTASVDSDHSMTWEDFFGSTTDLAPAIISIYDSLLEPSKNPSDTIETAKDARNDPPVKETKTYAMTVDYENKTSVRNACPKDPSKIVGSVKLPITMMNKSTLYAIRSKSDKDGANVDNIKDETTVHDNKSFLYNSSKNKIQNNIKTESNAFNTFSPNVKRMLSSASETPVLKFQKKNVSSGRSSMRLKSNIPLVGATSKISQSGVEMIPSVGIYDKPNSLPTNTAVAEKNKTSHNEIVSSDEIKPKFKINEIQTTYDVPTNNRLAIYDVPNIRNKTAFESLSLPYIDQSIDASASTCDREFDSKISSADASPLSPDCVKVITTSGVSSSNIQPEKILENQRNLTSPKKLLDSLPYPEKIASTENLKTIVTQNKFSPKHCVPSIEVSRPLSMSSIASSSSTSSSGLHNKGGINSAYLASIESLDDHSDADFTSANGSNNFVNEAGANGAPQNRSMGHLPEQQTEDLTGLSQLERVCLEIIQTENVYVEDLRQVVEGYLQIWRREKTFSEEELSELFNNIEDIFAFNKSLCSSLGSSGLDAVALARCFLANSAGFSVYTSYCTGYPKTMQTLAALASRPESVQEFRERQTALKHPLPLGSYLLKPVQRILKYHLLLQNVVKLRECAETRGALAEMTAVARRIDLMKRRHEHAVRVQEIQSLLYGWSGSDLTTYGELCAEGTFRVLGAKAMRHVFLFDKMVLVTKSREDGVLAYKTHIMCNNLMLVESVSRAPLALQLIPWDAPKAHLTLRARSPAHKREWSLLLKRVILENYNAVIPSHARQLVMELGQNKTDDDMIAEKSYNLISQASIRRQLSAPEYLEKRKLDRERKKSAENNLRGRYKKSNTKQSKAQQIILQCDCAQYSANKDVDYVCEECRVDICLKCERLSRKDSCEVESNETPSVIKNAESTGALEKNKPVCGCSKVSGSLKINRDYHSSDNIVNYTNDGEEVDFFKCEKCRNTFINVSPARKNRNLDESTSRTKDIEKLKFKEDSQRYKFVRIGTWRRKSEPGLQQNEDEFEQNTVFCNTEDASSNGKLEFKCKNCGSTKINKNRGYDRLLPNPDDCKGLIRSGTLKSNIEVKMYNSKNIPKKISTLKKNRAKRQSIENKSKFYTDFLTEASTENVLHISESNDSLSDEKSLNKQQPPTTIDSDIDEDTYKKLIEKTDSFKKNELEKRKHLNHQKSIKENDAEERVERNVDQDVDEIEQPLEQIISQLLMQNREFQNLLKRHKQRNTAQRRHQRLLKSHSNPEPILDDTTDKLLISEDVDSLHILENANSLKKESGITYQLINDSNILKDSEENHIYETLKIESENITTVCQSDLSPLPHSTCLIPEKIPQDTSEDSDYVYLAVNKTKFQYTEGIYDVPMKPSIQTNSKNFSSNDRDNDVHQNCLTNKDTNKSEALNPNTPEIWLRRQKENFTSSIDRKSGSLPRSFQIINNKKTNENKLKYIPLNEKTYINKEGKVKSAHRPFAIASDKSDISYDNAENCLNDSNLKLNVDNHSASNTKHITRRTLELEQEINECYKKNLEELGIISKNDNESCNESEHDLDISSLSREESTETITNDDIKEYIHPEHKVYKPYINISSLKNVLSRFKNLVPNKNHDQIVDEIHYLNTTEALDQKTPGVEKSSALNPKNYSKNLLQRFKSIVNDEVCEDDLDSNVIENKANIKQKDIIKAKHFKKETTLLDSGLKMPTSDMKSEHLSIKQPESTRLDENSKSTLNSETYCKFSDKSKEDFPHSPIYMQGSRKLGARIAQPDYIDPSTLSNDKLRSKNVNILINKNSLRPDSLFSNLSFTTSSSEGINPENCSTSDEKSNIALTNHFSSINTTKLDESFYEKSFEQIENIIDEEPFRDSAIYSDQDDQSDLPKDNIKMLGTNNTKSNKVIPQNMKLENPTATKLNPKNKEISNTNYPIQDHKNNFPKKETLFIENQTNFKTAPPIPIKPKMSYTQTANNIIRTQSKIHLNAKTNTNTPKQTPSINKYEDPTNASREHIDKIEVNKTQNYSRDISVKRLSFQRGSLDSASRKFMNNNKNSDGSQRTVGVKSVLERTMELEQLTRKGAEISNHSNNKVQTTKYGLIATKVATFETNIGSKCEDPKSKNKLIRQKSLNLSNEVARNQTNQINDENVCNMKKDSWVKQVVNKFE